MRHRRGPGTLAWVNDAAGNLHDSAGTLALVSSEIETKFKIFISWSKSPSKEVADVVKALLIQVLDGVEAWVSEQDLVPGSRPMQAIHENLRLADAGVLLITKANQSNPWINYEAGVLAQRVYGHNKSDNLVIPLLIDATTTAEITGPLADLQSVSFTKEGMLKVIQGLSGPSKTPAEVAKARFESVWDDIKRQFDQVLSSAVLPEEIPARTQQDKIDEILERVRRLEPSSLNPLSPAPSDWTYSTVHLGGDQE